MYHNLYTNRNTNVQYSHISKNLRHGNTEYRSYQDEEKAAIVLPHILCLFYNSLVNGERNEARRYKRDTSILDRGYGLFSLCFSFGYYTV